MVSMYVSALWMILDMPIVVSLELLYILEIATFTIVAMSTMAALVLLLTVAMTSFGVFYKAAILLARAMFTCMKSNFFNP